MRSPLLCDVIAAPTMAELRAGRDRVDGADLVELRLDTVDRPDVAGALEGRRRPVVVTCRAAWEGGHFRGSEEERQRILRQALEGGAEFVDIEWRAEGVEAWLRPADLPRVVRSLHDFERMPADLAGVVREMRRSGAGVVKVAGRASTLRDLLPLIDVGRAQGAAAEADGAAQAQGGQRLVLIGMGMCGLPSRILAAHLGSCWTYAGPAVAPGQIEAARLLDEFRFRTITPATRVYAVVGWPIAHSISPAMHNAAFAAAGIDAVYVPCEAADFEDFLALAAALPIDGASVTAPFKLAAFERGRAMDEDARRVGAANTLRRVMAERAEGNVEAVRDDAMGERTASDASETRRGAARWECRNTDVAGFLAPLDGQLSLRAARVAILGTGGAARAVAVGLGAAGALVTVYARNTAAGAEVAALAGGRVREWQGASADESGARPARAQVADAAGESAATAGPSEWDLLVNTTPIGTYPAIDETPFPNVAAALSRSEEAHGRGGAAPRPVVYDLVYNPRPTRLLRDAAAAGCLTIDGLDMLVEQAALQFAWWTGRAPSIEAMRAAAERRLAEMAAEETTAKSEAPPWDTQSKTRQPA